MRSPYSGSIWWTDLWLQLIAIVAEEKGLELTRRPKKNMCIEDVAEFVRVLLTTTEMTFECGWQRMQLLFFCQLAALTGVDWGRSSACATATPR